MKQPKDTADRLSVGLADIETAKARIAGRLRRTPVIKAAPNLAPITEGELWLKLECLQVTGSFKPRGATNRLLTLDDAAVQRGIITASGGNHGLAVAYVGRQAGVPAVIYLPESTPQAKADKIASYGAEVHIHGAGWDEANEAALAEGEVRGLTYLHPFADPNVIAGQGTLGLEILEDLPETDLLIVSIGGGGLMAGVSTAVKALKPGARVIGVEPTGAPTLSSSLSAGQLVSLPAIETRAGTLAPRRSAEVNLALIADHVDEIVLVSDQEMTEAARWLWRELGVAAELSGAAAVAALQSGRVTAKPGEKVTAIICGAGTDGL
ncbi:MAG: threonine/serine dehydratase [Pseudomonadota bacterium]